MPSIRNHFSRILPLSLHLVGWLCSATSVVGQAPPSPRLGPEGNVGAHMGAFLGVGTLKGILSPQLGGRIGVDLSPWLRVGGEGTVVLDAPRVLPEDTPDATELSLGYGGVFLELSPASVGSANLWSAGILLGAGTARIRSARLGSELDSRNFFLAEPSVARHLRLRGPLVGETRLAYRIPLNARPPLGVRPADLRGASLRITLYLVRSP